MKHRLEGCVLSRFFYRPFFALGWVALAFVACRDPIVGNWELSSISSYPFPLYVPGPQTGRIYQFQLHIEASLEGAFVPILLSAGAPYPVPLHGHALDLGVKVNARAEGYEIRIHEESAEVVLSCSLFERKLECKDQAGDAWHFREARYAPTDVILNDQ